MHASNDIAAFSGGDSAVGSIAHDTQSTCAEWKHTCTDQVVRHKLAPVSWPCFGRSHRNVAWKRAKMTAILLFFRITLYLAITLTMFIIFLFCNFDENLKTTFCQMPVRETLWLIRKKLVNITIFLIQIWKKVKGKESWRGMRRAIFGISRWRTRNPISRSSWANIRKSTSGGAGWRLWSLLASPRWPSAKEPLGSVTPSQKALTRRKGKVPLNFLLMSPWYPNKIPSQYVSLDI